MLSHRHRNHDILCLCEIKEKHKSVLMEVFEIKLKTVAVSKKLKEYKEIKSLMRRAFPQNEQIPMWLLHILAIRKSVEFSAYYDEDLFCGISYTASNEDLVFILYLAVNDKIRSKGYGSAIA